MVLADTDRAALLASEALERATANADMEQQLYAHITLALVGLRQTTGEMGHVHLAEAERLLGSRHDQRATLLVRHVKAQRLRMDGELPAALTILNELHDEAEQRPPVDAYLTLAALGSTRSVIGDYHGALVAYYEALSAAERCDNLSIEVNALNNLGAAQLDLYNLEDARPLLERCLAGALRLTSRRQTIFAAGNLVQCLCALGQPSEALDLVRSHLLPNIVASDPPSLQRDEEIAHAFVDNAMWDEARAYLRRAPQLDVLTNDTSACRAWLEARLMMADGRPAQALQICLRHKALGEDDSSVPVDRVRLAELGAEAARQIGDHKEAFDQLQRAYGIHVELLGRAAKARFVSLQIEHELQRTRGERDEARVLAQRLKETNATLSAQVAANEVMQGQLRSLALEDPLTGIYNRRYLFQAAPGLIDQARRRREPVSVVLLDLDHFKLVNDRFGHDHGDRVLKRFASLMRDAVRASDICCRYGGEEFVVVFSNLDAEHASRRMNELLAIAQSEAESDDDTDLLCSFSAGIAVSDPAEEDLDDMLKRADEAMYYVKATGRARVDVAVSR